MRRNPRKITGRIVPLASREADEPPCPPTVAERLTLVFQLSREAWELSGRPFPSYARTAMPVRIRKLSEQGDD